MKELTHAEAIERYSGNYIHPTAIIYDGVQMGTGNYIGPYCIIGAPAEKAGCFDSAGKVKICDGNRFTKQVTIDSGTTQNTVIMDNCLFLKNSHVGHDCALSTFVTLACNVAIGGFTTVLDNCGFGLNAVVLQRLLIPHGCFFGMGSVVTKKSELTAGMKYLGNPLRCIGRNYRI